MIYWNNAADFFAMGGYGLYVWGSYGVTAVCLLIEPLIVRRRHRRAVRAAAGLHASFDRDPQFLKDSST